MRGRLASLGLAFLLSGCSLFQSISSNPVQDVPILGPIALKDLQATDFNFQQAIKAQILLPLDPVAGCVHIAAQDAQAAGGGFKPEIQGLMSAASVLYIQRVQATRLQQDVLQFVSCISGAMVVKPGG